MPSGRRRRRTTTAQSLSKLSGTDRKGAAAFYDLNVPLTIDTQSRNNHGINKGDVPKRGPKEEQFALVRRLRQTGYSVVALSYSINGKFNPDKDIATKNVPTNLELYADAPTKRRKLEEISSTTSSISHQNDSLYGSEDAKILKRLNVTIQEASELGNYCSNISNVNMVEALKSYDIIAMTPQNDASFTSICTMSNLFYCDIITLDYSSGRGGVQLPFKLRTIDIKAATNRGLVFELPYGPALTDPSKRKAFVQTARLFLNASVGVKDENRQSPKIIISSGERVFENKDYGAMALRSPLDMMNFVNVVLGFDQKLASDAFSNNAFWAVQRGRNRRVGKVASSSLVDARKGSCIPLTFELIDGPVDDIVTELKSRDSPEEIESDVEGCSDATKLQQKQNEVEFDHDEDFLKL